MSSLRFLANPFGNVPWARDSGHPGMTSHIGRVRCCLPLLQRRRRGDKEYFGAESSRLASSLSTLRTLRSPGEWQDSLLTCLLDFGQAGFSPARLGQEVSLTRHQILLFQIYLTR